MVPAVFAMGRQKLEEHIDNYRHLTSLYGSSQARTAAHGLEPSPQRIQRLALCSSEKKRISRGRTEPLVHLQQPVRTSASILPSIEKERLDRQRKHDTTALRNNSD